MSIELSSELEQLVRSRIDSGRYGTASDVLRDALGLLEEHELYLAAHRDDIRERIATGYASLRAGKFVDGDTVFDRLQKELNADLT